MATDSGQAGQLAAFVTGAGSGIGRATAWRLGRDGYKVGVFDLDPGGVQLTVDGIVSSGGQAVGFVGDVRDEVVVTSALEALARGARLWLVANVAGIGMAGTVVESSGGVIVNVASVGGLVGIAARAAYCASKAGVIGLTKAIAVDHAAAGIRAVALCPGRSRVSGSSRSLQIIQTPPRRVERCVSTNSTAGWVRLMRWLPGSPSLHLAMDASLMEASS